MLNPVMGPVVSDSTVLDSFGFVSRFGMGFGARKLLPSSTMRYVSYRSRSSVASPSRRFGNASCHSVKSRLLVTIIDLVS